MSLLLYLGKINHSQALLLVIICDGGCVAAGIVMSSRQHIISSIFVYTKAGLQLCEICYTIDKWDHLNKKISFISRIFPLRIPNVKSTNSKRTKGSRDVLV